MPFLYTTNGEIIHSHDVRRAQNRSRVVSHFHTPNALRALLSRDLDLELRTLGQIPVSQRLRPHQIEVVHAL